MYDINFFSVFKKKKSSSNGFKIFLIVFLGLFVLANASIIGYGLLQFNKLESSIDAKQAQVDSPETKDKIAEAARIKQEYALTSEYLTLLQGASSKLIKMDLIGTDLLDTIREMTPPTTQFIFTEYNGINIDLECVTPLLTDPMDMYHTFLENPIFATVTLSSIDNQEGLVSFTLNCQLAGGDIK